jgi:hypothetical protein
MATYIELPLTADATALSDTGKDYMSGEIDGWTPRPGNVESVLLEANGQIAAEVVDQAAQVDPAVFAYFGQSILGIAIRDAIPATGLVDFTFDAGFVGNVPAGTTVAFPNPDGNSYAFVTDDDVFTDATHTTSVTGLESGPDPNGSQGVGQLIDTVDGVSSLAMNLAASGGVAEETTDEYVDRLADALTILAPRPILPQDFATMARQVPGVGRAVAIDLLQPPASAGGYGQPRGAEPNGTTPVERCVTVAITAEDGTAPSASLMQTVWALLDANREVNFLEYVIPPAYTAIDVQATVHPYPGYIAAEVKAAAEAMLADWLDPNAWGSEATGEETSWATDTKVRIYEAVDYLNRAAGVFYVVSVQVKRSVDSVWSNVDIVLPGVAPLPMPGALTVTVA